MYTFQKSDFETILDFHIQHLDQLLLHYGSSQSSAVAQDKTSLKMRQLGKLWDVSLNRDLPY